MKIIKAIDRFVGKLVDSLGLLSMGILFVLLIINVFLRMINAPVSLSWYSEAVEILFAWMVMIGAVSLCSKAEHFRVDLFKQKLGAKRGFWWLESFCQLVALAFYLYFLYFSFHLTVGAPQTMPVLKIPKGVAYACMPICAVWMCIYALRDLCVAFGRAIGKLEIPEVEKRV